MESERYSGRSTALGGSLLGRFYRRLYVHPTRFYGDLQKSGISNWHQRVADFTSTFDPHQRVLDLGCGARRIGSEVIAADLDVSLCPQVGADAHRLPFADNSFDAIVLQHVLEHVQNPEQVIVEVRRVLRPGGVVFCEVPFLFPVHHASDYRRWTESGLRGMCNGLAIVESGVSMGPFSALSALLRRTLTLPARSVKVEGALDLVIGWILWPIKHIDRLFRPRDVRLVAGAVYVIAEKS